MCTLHIQCNTCTCTCTYSTCLCICIVLQCLVNSLFTGNTGMCIVLQITAHWKIGGFFCMSGACSECTRGCPAASSVQTHTAPQRSNTHETSFATTLHNYVMYIVHVCRLCIHVLKAVGRNKNYIHLNMCIQYVQVHVNIHRHKGIKCVEGEHTKGVGGNHHFLCWGRKRCVYQ